MFATCASSVPLLHGRAPLPVIYHCMVITAVIASAPMMIFHVCCNLTQFMARAMPAMMIVGHRGAAVRLMEGHTRGRGTCWLHVCLVCASFRQLARQVIKISVRASGHLSSAAGASCFSEKAGLQIPQTHRVRSMFWLMPAVWGCFRFPKCLRRPAWPCPSGVHASGGRPLQRPGGSWLADLSGSGLIAVGLRRQC